MAIDTLPRCTKCGYSIRMRNYRHDSRTALLGEHFECPKKPSRAQLRRVAAILDGVESRDAKTAELLGGSSPLNGSTAPAAPAARRSNGAAASDALADVQAIYVATLNPAERRRMLDLLADYAKDAAVSEWAQAERRRVSPEYGLRQSLSAYLVDTLPRDVTGG